jgi:hypothetical protein
MVATIPPLLVEKPTPEFPLRYGLFQAAVGPLDLPENARNGGLQYLDAMCGPGFGYAIACLPDQATKTFGNNLETVLGVPFIVGATFTCAPVGLSDAEIKAFGAQRLLSVEQTIVEQVFSSGDFSQAPSLANNPAVVDLTATSPNAVTPVEVISVLERAGYCTQPYGPPLYLHMPIPVFNELKSAHLIEFDGKRWRTPMGSVVVGGCYAGETPAGAAPADGTFWVYATGQTTIWRTPDEELFVAPVEGYLDRTFNQVNMLVEREYVVTFECGVFAKAVTLWAP